MHTNFYAVRLFMLALTIAAGADLEVPLDLAVEWPPGLLAASA
jgi:hypothetical protein